jgi:putative ABC transport system permease protein
LSGDAFRLGLVLRAGRRALWRHPVQTLLAVLGVAVGVAVVVAVDLANASAKEAMRLAIDRVAGAATHQIVGSGEGVPQGLYRRLRVDLGLQAAAPVVEGGVTLADGRPLRLLGLDPFAEAPFRSYVDVSAGDAGGVDLTALLVTPGTVLLPRDEASRLGVDPGSELALVTPTGRVPVTVTGLLEADTPLRGLIFADIATAQELLGELGRLDRIDLILEPEQVAAVESTLPEGLRLIAAEARGNALAQMSDAFHVNLAALSLLALVVGLFLVFNTMSFLVLRRRRMLGTLRALGVTRAQVFVQVLADAGVVAILGTLLGLPLGLLLATGLTDLVLRTINDLYFQSVGGLALQPLSLAKGAALGLAGTLAAGLPAAREAVSVTPREALSRSGLERRARAAARWMAVSGIAVLAFGAVVLVAWTGLVAGFVGLFAIIIGAGLLAPMASLGLGLIVARATRGRASGRLLAGGAVASLSRTGVAVAALAVAVASVVGVAVMIDSFRGSVVDWLRQSLRADFYVSASAPLNDGHVQRLRAVAGVVDLSRSRWLSLPTAEGDLQLWALDPADHEPLGFDIRRGDPRRAVEAFFNEQAVLVSEPFARDRDVDVGDAIELATPEGARRFRVAGVFRDYGAVSGVAVMRLSLYRELWNDPALGGIGVYAAAGSGLAASDLEAALAGVPGAGVRDNGIVFERSLEVFDQTFVITSVLRLLAAVVAFVGVFGALMALQLDRAREYATLRALGLTRRQLGVLITGQSGLLGLAAGLLAMPLGLLLAWLLVTVINRRAFGWSMDFIVAAQPLLEGILLAVVAALLAAVYPAWRTAQRLPADGLREE